MAEPSGTTPNTPPPPEPTEKDLKIAQVVASYVSRHIDTPEKEVAFLAQKTTATMVTRWLESTIQGVLENVVIQDRNRILTLLQQALNDQRERTQVQKAIILGTQADKALKQSVATGPILDELTVQSMLIGLQNLMGTVPPPRIQLTMNTPAVPPKEQPVDTPSD